ncbi:N-acetylmuramoyl-L-alanine amidase [Pseudomonas helleri]|uniref:N-acetylmuramoyl-L-alanine amidase AmiC n=2 Tax=Bacteria TaxID=2 RepID=A0A7X1XJX9_9PSED|nr:N-acetylmuramoyl-L-alanine amidase [Pseudomonas helleri]MQT92514.1 AMIN domain-containing protein [Pseudomonas helleri]
MNRRHLLQLLIAGIALPWPLYASAKERITNIRAWHDEEKMRLVLDLSGPLPYRTFELDSPKRLILDLDNALFNASLDDVQLDGSVITSIRTGIQAQGTRMVLNLAGTVEATSFILPPGDGRGHRLVVDLIAKSAMPPLNAPPAQVKDVRQRDIVVVIDAGHGGKDPGAVGAKGEKEKVVALAIARQLAQKINNQKGFKAQLVRNTDMFIPLRKRVEIARKHNADTFISIHADAAPRKSASGASVFALSENGATSTTASWMARRENSADLIGARDVLSLKDKDPVLAGVILDMSLTSTIATSLDIGKTILGSLGKISGIHQKRVEQAGFAVLKSPDIPSILVETGFISNANDCRRLTDRRHQKRVAESILTGIKSHFFSNPPIGTLLAS